MELLQAAREGGLTAEAAHQLTGFTASDQLLGAAAYHLASVLALGAVRQSKDGDWEAVVRKVEAIEHLVEG